MDEEKEVRVRRYPILIGEHTVALLQLFIKSHDSIDDIWSYDYLGPEALNTQQFAARQFVEQLKDHWTPAFMMELRDAIIDKLREHDKEFGTKFAETKNEKELRDLLDHYSSIIDGFENKDA